MEEKTTTDEMEKLFAASVHLGHRKNRLHPRAKKYVYKMVNGVAIIDLTLTVKSLDGAKSYLKKLCQEGKTILVVATKKIASNFTAKLCDEKNIPHVTVKWPSGLLTNFETIMNNVKRLNELEKQQTEGAWDKFVKHEKVKLTKEIAKLKKFYGGISKLTKKPDALLILDIKKEKNALNEAHQNNLPSVAVLDTNSNPDTVNYPVIGNDDSATSVEYLMKELISAYSTDK